jgi:hypothetical protein
MRRLKLSILFALYCVTAAVVACPQNGDTDSFLKFRENFIDASLRGRAEDVVEFYQFPLLAGGMYEETRNLKISRETFMKLYEVLFVKTSLNGAPVIFRDLSKGKEVGSSFLPNIGLPNGCIKERRLKNGIYDAHYKFELRDGKWKVTYVGFAEGYKEALDELKSRNIDPW